MDPRIYAYAACYVDSFTKRRKPELEIIILRMDTHNQTKLMRPAMASPDHSTHDLQHLAS